MTTLYSGWSSLIVFFSWPHGISPHVIRAQSATKLKRTPRHIHRALSLKAPSLLTLCLSNFSHLSLPELLFLSQFNETTTLCLVPCLCDILQSEKCLQAESQGDCRVGAKEIELSISVLQLNRKPRVRRSTTSLFKNQEI